MLLTTATNVSNMSCDRFIICVKLIVIKYVFFVCISMSIDKHVLTI